MLFQCDEQLLTSLFKGDYFSHLHSEDLLDNLLPLTKLRAKGGTMVMWKKSLDQYITVWTRHTSSGFLPLVFSFPEASTSIHITIYLPTSGQDAQFIEELAKLDNCIQEMTEEYPDALLFIRGDANVNMKDKSRVDLLHKLCQDWGLVLVEIPHPTYHHFLGDGSSDSNLDVLIHTETASENLVTILCKLDNPLISSHHDVLISKFSLLLTSSPRSAHENPLAPTIPNSRVKIQWSSSGIELYRNSIDQTLSRMRATWLDSSSPASFSVLLQSTYSFLDHSARNTNKYIDLGKERTHKSARKPSPIVRSERRILRHHQVLKSVRKDSMAYITCNKLYREEKRRHNRLSRLYRVRDCWLRDRTLDGLLSRDPFPAYQSIKRLRSSRQQKVNIMKVGSWTYHGETVPDGIFESIRSLKSDPIPPNNDPSIPCFEEEFRLILDMCASGKRIPPVSMKKSCEILRSIRRNVNDLYSITASHFLNAGVAGEEHFHFIFNAVISNINLGGIPELNSVYACVLFKGHGKDRTSARSYRTISTCPLVSKALDSYIRELSLPDWNKQQSDTQYQGEGSSHEVAALLLTEVIQHSLHVKKRPVFALFLDAKSAFDRVLKEILVRKLFLAGTDGHALLYLDQRLKNRKTFCEFDKKLMGPILDNKGLEQGGFSSSDLYKIYNNEQSMTAQRSGLGVTVHDQTVSLIALADDAAIVSDNIIFLNHLLYLTTQYCSKYGVELVPDKTKLLAFSSKENIPWVKYAELTSQVELYGQKILFSNEAEHLGILRTNTPTNMPNILVRLQEHNKKLFSVLPAGLGLGHHANPAACVRAEQLYALPVLLSGLSALVLRRTEVDMISACYKNTLQRIMKLREKTPDCAVYFLAGSLPGQAVLHLRQLSLFLMICHLKDDILHSLARSTLIKSKPSANSWFQGIRGLCIQYQLPHPLILLDSPPPKTVFKKLCKEKVLEFWHARLTMEAAALPSLRYLRPHFLSLSSPHPIFTSLDGNPYQARAAKIQALFLSGRYCTERLCRFWSGNKGGFCLLDSCRNLCIVEDLEHIILQCTGLNETRRRLVRFTTDYIAAHPIISDIVQAYLYSHIRKVVMQFIIDCSVLPMVISAYQTNGPLIHSHLYKITRTWCRSLHRDRLKSLGRYIQD